MMTRIEKGNYTAILTGFEEQLIPSTSKLGRVAIFTILDHDEFMGRQMYVLSEGPSSLDGTKIGHLARIAAHPGSSISNAATINRWID